MATPDDRLDDFVRALIRHKTRQMVGRAGYTDQDRPDLEQELIACLLKALPDFDPDQAPRPAFLTMVIERGVAELYRRRLTRKRNAGLLASLDAPRAPEPADRRASTSPDLVLDLAEFLATLPAELRAMAERLKQQTVAEAARDLGIPRSTLMRKVQQVRRRFEDVGLAEYL